MKSKGLATGIVMLALLLSVLTIPLGAMASWNEPASPITFIVADTTNGDPIKGADWYVLSTIDGEVLDNGITESDGSAETDSLTHDNYLIRVEMDGYQYNTVLIEYYDDEYHLGEEEVIIIGLIPFSDPVSINVNVDGVSAGTEIEVTAQHRLDEGKGISVTNSVTNGTVSNSGVASINMLVENNTDYTLIVKAKHPTMNYVTYVGNHSVDGSDINISLQTGLNGFVGKDVDLNVTFVKDASGENDERIRYADVNGRNFNAVLDDGIYDIYVVATGYKTVFGELNVSGSSYSISGDGLSKVSGAIRVALTAEDKRDVNYRIDFGDNMSTFEYAVTMMMDCGYSVGILPYSELPLRAQIDMLYNGDGEVNATEAASFLSLIEGWTAAFPAVTDGFLAVDGVSYHSSTLSVEAVGLEGDTKSTDGFTIYLNDSYSALDSITADKVNYNLKAKLPYDTANIDYSYTFVLPQSYEVMDFRSLETAYLNIEREDAGVFTFDVDAYSGYASVNMTVTTSTDPTAVGAIVSSEYAYAETDDGVKYYIVGANREVTFDASQSTDGNGNPLKTYTWEFGDGNTSTSNDEQVNYTYERGGEYTVNLTVENYYERESKTNFTVKVDAIKPIAKIEVNTAVPKVSQAVNFVGYNSSDDLLEEGDKLGKIAKWTWNFGDGVWANVTSNGGNISHTYQEVGEYTVNLTVTDVGGNNASCEYVITINRAEKPKLTVSIPDNMPGFEEGSMSTITITVNNTGDWKAENIVVRLYVMSGDKWVQKDSAIIAALEPNENGTVQLKWTPDSQGSYRLKVEATTTYLGEDVTGTNYTTVTVDEASWKNIAIFAAVIIVIVVIIVLVYYRNRLPGGGRLNLKGKDQMTKAEKPIEDFEDFEEPKKSPPKSSSKKKKR